MIECRMQTSIGNKYDNHKPQMITFITHTHTSHYLYPPVNLHHFATLCRVSSSWI